MLKISKILSVKPARWLGVYVITISTLALVFSSFKPKSKTDHSQLIDSTVVKNIINKEIKKGKSKGINQKDTSAKIDSLIEKINPLQKYLDKYKAVDFNSYSFPFTIDYQKNLKNKTVIFYILVQDLFQENKHYYIKAAKSLFGMNIYLKIECEIPMIKRLKKTQFFTYAVIKVKQIDNVYFDARAASGSGDEDYANITLSSKDKNLFIQGKCIDIF